MIFFQQKVDICLLLPQTHNFLYLSRLENFLFKLPEDFGYVFRHFSHFEQKFFSR